jgi:MFS family permease
VPPPDSLGALRERQFRLVFSAQAVSVLGDNIVPVALAFAVLDLTHSASDLGLVLAARTIPLVVFILVGGVWADRLPRQRLMVTSDLVHFMSQALMAALLVTGTATVLQLIVLQAVHGTATAFYRPASSGLIPQTVSRARLQQANALLFVALSVGTILGPVLAGVLVAVTDPGWAIALDAVTFAISGALLIRVKPLGLVTVSEGRGFFADLAGGWQEVRSRTWLWLTIVDAALFQFAVLGSFFVLGPLVAEHALHSKSAWALILAAFGLGAVIGGAAALRFHPRRPLVALHVVMLGVAPGLILLALHAPTLLIASAEVLAGFAMGFGGTLWETTLQERIRPDALSRVSAWDWMGSGALRPLGLIAAGPVAAAIGVRPTLLGAAAVLLCSSGISLVVPSVRHVVRPRHLHVPAAPSEPEPAPTLERAAEA